MSKAEKNNWEERYARDDQEAGRHPLALLSAWLNKAKKGKALDLASGTGRNAFFLAENGYAVTAIDVSATALRLAEEEAQARGLRITWIEADLDSYTLTGQYDLILASFFKIRKQLAPAIIKALTGGGLLIYESHMTPPANPEEARKHQFHFQPGELRDLFSGLTILHYDEHQAGEKDGHPAWIASLVARKDE